MPTNGHNDAQVNADEVGIDEAHLHLTCVREALAGYAEVAGMTVVEILLPSMPESTRRHASGQALVALLKALDPPHGGGKDPQNHPGKNERPDRFADVPFLVCTLQDPETGVRVAVLGTAAAGT